jgi:hypothetical protein
MHSGPVFRYLTIAFAAISLASCGTNGSSTPIAPVQQPTTAPTGTFTVRAVHGSPDAGPVDIYVFPKGGTQSATPGIANLQYPGITSYYPVAAGTYTVDVYAAGTQTLLASETITGAANQQLTTVVAGQVANSTVQFQNFVEPVETAGVAAAIVHHASPAVNAAVSPVAVGVYTASSSGAPAASSTIQAFTFALATATATTPGLSGPAAPGTTSGGEYFAPLSAALPTPLGFAAGAPGTGGQLGSVATFTTVSGLATALNPAGYGLTSLESTLAADTANAVPAGAHVSVFAVDSVTNPPGILIGTLDP